MIGTLQKVSEPLSPFGGSERDDPPRLLPHSHLPGRVSPITRLDFWKVRHQLTLRLLPYQATETPTKFQSSTWNTLRYWALLLDEDLEFSDELVPV